MRYCAVGALHDRICETCLSHVAGLNWKSKELSFSILSLPGFVCPEINYAILPIQVSLFQVQILCLALYLAPYTRDRV